jgi:Protein of unknown function (DUF4197)
MKSSRIIIAAVALTLSLGWLGCDTLTQIQKGVESAGTPALTETEIANGLREALQVGTGNAVNVLNATDGYFKDPLVKILFPPEAQRASDKLRELGMGKLVDDFTLSLNRGAEKAAKEAGPIFVDAIKAMTIQDAKNILQGADNAATEYFKGKTTTQLHSKFYPVIQNSLNSVNATKHWTDITTTYNRIPLVQPVNTDLADYTTKKALDGLFLKLAGEEKKIRENPAARVSELLKKVFGSLDKK